MFTCSEDKHGLRQTQFVLCGELLAAESMKPSKFNRQLETKCSYSVDVMLMFILFYFYRVYSDFNKLQN